MFFPLQVRARRSKGRKGAWGALKKKTLLVNKAAFLKDRKGLQVAVGAREEVPTCTPYGRSSEAPPTLRRSAETLKSLFKAVFLTFS